MVRCSDFFFANVKSIHKKYKTFFGDEDKDIQDSESDTEQITQIPATEATARFYFQLTHQLANEDITKFSQIEELSLYLCLNRSALIKDKMIAEQNEIKKLKNEMKNNR